jgi:hypothetical protein
MFLGERIKPYIRMVTVFLFLDQSLSSFDISCFTHQFNIENNNY